MIQPQQKFTIRWSELARAVTGLTWPSLLSAVSPEPGYSAPLGDLPTPCTLRMQRPLLNHSHQHTDMCLLEVRQYR